VNHLVATVNGATPNATTAAQILAPTTQAEVTPHTDVQASAPGTRRIASLGAAGRTKAAAPTQGMVSAKGKN